MKFALWFALALVLLGVGAYSLSFPAVAAKLGEHGVEAQNARIAGVLTIASGIGLLVGAVFGTMTSSTFALAILAMGSNVGAGAAWGQEVHGVAITIPGLGPALPLMLITAVVAVWALLGASFLKEEDAESREENRKLQQRNEALQDAYVAALNEIARLGGTPPTAIPLESKVLPMPPRKAAEGR